MVEIHRYPFSRDALSDLRNNAFAAGSWPLVYLLSDEEHRRAYIGETTDALTRMSTHLKHDEKQLLTAVHLITSEYFNKSATLDVESLLIKYMAADGKYTLLNGNLGLADHNYYQRSALYEEVFREVWNRLIAKGVVSRTLDHLDNSDVFKYSPYKSLSFDQRQGLLTIMHELLNPRVTNIVAPAARKWTAKTVLALPAVPATRVVRARGRPPWVTRSTPGMPLSSFRMGDDTGVALTKWGSREAGSGGGRRLGRGRR